MLAFFASWTNTTTTTTSTTIIINNICDRLFSQRRLGHKLHEIKGVGKDTGFTVYTTLHCVPKTSTFLFLK